MSPPIPGSSPRRLQPGHLRVVCVADRSPKAAVQFATVEDDLLGMHRLYGIQRDAELAGILHVHHLTIRRYVPDGAELVVPIGNERLVPDFDRLSLFHRSRFHSSTRCSTYWDVYPPSTGTIWPVTNDAPSEQSQMTVLAISSGRPMRPIGCADSSICLISGVVAKS